MLTRIHEGHGGIIKSSCARTCLAPCMVVGTPSSSFVYKSGSSSMGMSSSISSASKGLLSASRLRSRSVVCSTAARDTSELKKKRRSYANWVVLMGFAMYLLFLAMKYGWIPWWLALLLVFVMPRPSAKGLY